MVNEDNVDFAAVGSNGKLPDFIQLIHINGCSFTVNKTAYLFPLADTQIGRLVEA